MNFNIIKTVGKTAMKVGTKMGFKLKKASPEICLVGGVALIIGGTIFACKATKKAEGELEEANAILDKIQEEREALDEESEDFAAQKKELTRSKMSQMAHTAGNLVKIYAPAVAAESLGIALIFVSHGIMKKRNAALIGAYNALDGVFRRYRDRVKEKIGEDAEKKLYLGERKDILVADDGTEVEDTVYDEVTKGDNPDIIHFNRYTSTRWSPNAAYNLLTLRSAEQWACDKLRLQGHLFLNELLDYLGMDRTRDGAIRGWIFENNGHDNYVDFGLCDAGQYDAWCADENSLKDDIVLTLDTHGLIWDRI